MDFKNTPKRPAATSKPSTQRPLGTTARKSDIDMSEIEASLRSIDEESTVKPKKAPKQPKPGKRKDKKSKKPWSRKRKIITWTIISIIVLLVAVGGYYAFRIGSSGGGIFQGSLLDIIRKDSLAADKHGRSNILIFGTSEDDPGHSGAQLADSIMVLSVNQETKDTTTLSIPRDLWVNYDQPCSVGSSGKINAVYLCALQAHNNDEQKASMAFADKVSEVIGTDVQYFVAINYTVVKSLVDSLGGVEVNVESVDPRGIYDVGTGLKLPLGTAQLDGETALDFSRARNAEGGYGLPQSNFDRERNQQKVLAAIQAKALQSGTLLDPNKVVNITESLGDNIRTNLKSSELRSALEVAQGVNSGAIKPLRLNDPNNQLVTTGPHNGQSIVRPVKGLTDYTDIHAYIASSFKK